MSVADTLTKQAGPLPVGVWLLVGVGGLGIAFWQRKGEDDERLVTDVREVPVPVGAIASPDQAPLVITPIFRVPDINVPPPTVIVNPAPAVPRTPVRPLPPMVPGTPPPPLPLVRPIRPAVPGPFRSPADARRTRRQIGTAPAKTSPTPVGGRTYTVAAGDTLSSIGRRMNVPWRRIYDANAAKLEGIARSRGRAAGTAGPTGIGHWIYPGTVLVIPA